MEIFDKVMTVLSELSGTKNISLNHELQKDIGLDSLQMVTLLLILEEKFQIVLDESDMNPFDLITVWHIVNLVEKYLGGAGHENKEKN